MPDVATTLATLGTDERAWGRAWHVPSTAPRSQRQALVDLAAAMDAPAPKVSSIPWPVLSAIGLGMPMMREVVAVRHQFDQPFVIDAAETTATFGLTATPRPLVGAEGGQGGRDVGHVRPAPRHVRIADDPSATALAEGGELADEVRVVARHLGSDEVRGPRLGDPDPAGLVRGQRVGPHPGAHQPLRVGGG